jgi:hypothetical protein
MSGEWGDWIEHDGKGCPCVGMYVRVVHEFWESQWEGVAKGGPSWDWDSDYERIIRYRIRRPRALLDMIDRAAELDKLGELEEM